jgi:Ca-activated chloride channel family protein
MCLALSTIAAGRAGQFAAGVNLVEVYTTVTDEKGEPIRGLNQDDFVVEEDGVPQAIRAFASGELPLALAVGIDRSFSVLPARLNGAIAAVGSLLEQLRDGDQAMLMAIGSQPEVLAPLSSDRGQARRALAGLDRWGTTPLLDAVSTAIEAIQSARGRRALILLSDGVDRYSTMTPTDLLARAREHDVLVYPVALGQRRPAFFAELAAITGGRSFHATSSAAIAAALSTIGAELRAQYLLGYTPAPRVDARDGWRSIRVIVKRPKARVRARDGYRMPS